MNKRPGARFDAGGWGGVLRARYDGEVGSQQNELAGKKGVMARMKDGSDECGWGGVGGLGEGLREDARMLWRIAGPGGMKEGVQRHVSS